MTHTFICPRCGGSQFGTTGELVDGKHVVTGIQCHNRHDGKPFQCERGSVTHEMRTGFRLTEKPCGWTGIYDEKGGYWT